MHQRSTLLCSIHYSLFYSDIVYLIIFGKYIYVCVYICIIFLFSYGIAQVPLCVSIVSHCGPYCLKNIMKQIPVKLHQATLLNHQTDRHVCNV